MKARIRSAVLLALVLLLTASSLGMQNLQQVSLAEQVITDLFERFGLPLVSGEEYAAAYQESSARLKMSGTWEAAAVVDPASLGLPSTTSDGRHIEGASGLYFREAAKHYGPSGMQDLPLHQLCSSKITVGISSVVGEDYDQLLQMDLDDISAEQRQFIQRVEYRGVNVTTISLPRANEQGELMGYAHTAIWQYGKWYLSIKLFTDNGGFMEPNGYQSYEKCPFDNHELPPLQEMYETLQDLSEQYGLGGESAPAEVPQPTYTATCDISWSEHVPMIFNVYVQDKDGNGLYGHPDDYLVVKIFWDIRRVPVNATTGLLAFRPARPLNRVAFADAEGYLTQDSNPVVLEVMTDSSGVARLAVRTDFWQYVPGISRASPIAWELVITRKYKALNGEGEAVIAEESLGTCRLSVDSVAYAWGVKGAVYNKQGGREPERLLFQGDLVAPGDILSAHMDSDGSKSYAMLTYIDGTRFGIRGNCLPVPGVSCDSFRIGEMTWGYVFWWTFGVTMAEASEEAMEFLIRTTSTRLAGPASLIFLADDIYDVGSFAFSQEWSDTCARLGSNPEEQAAILNDFYQASNVDTRPRLRCTDLSIRSLVNARIENGQLDIQTFEGNPSISDDAGSFELLAGQQFTARYDGTEPQITTFDADLDIPDWDPAFFAAPEPFQEDIAEDQPNEPFTSQPLPVVTQISILWVGIPAVFCLGVSFVVLIAGVFIGNKKVRNSGAILLVLSVCIAAAGIAIYMIQFLAAPDEIPSMAEPVESQTQITSVPPEITSPQIPSVITDEPQNAEPEVPPVLNPFPNENTPQPTIYNFAACLEPCADDLSNNQTTFPGGIERIYIRFDYAWIPPGLDFARVWKYEGTEWVRYQCQWDGPESGVFETSFREPGGFRSGEWSLEIYVDGQQVFQTAVTIDGNWDFWEPAGTINRCP